MVYFLVDRLIQAAGFGNPHHLFHQIAQTDILGNKFTGNFTTVDDHNPVGDIVDMDDIVINKNGRFTGFFDAINKVDKLGCLFEG